MEESSEKRRERLRAMREEASLAGDDEGVGPSVANPPDASALPLPSHLRPSPESPSPSFEFYTDPLAAFSGSQRKKKSRSSFGSSFGAGMVAPPREPPASPLRQPSFAPPNAPATAITTPNAPFPSFSRTPNSNPSPSLTPPGSFSPAKHGHNHSGTVSTPGHFNSFYPYPSHHPIPRGNFYPNSTPPGGFNTPSSSNPGSSACGPRSAPYSHNGTTYTNSPASSQYNGGRGSLSTQSPQWPVGVVNENCVPSQGSNNSWGSFRQSPGSSSRGTPGKSGGRGFYRSQSGYAESAAPESFAKRSMLEDPWKDLVPVRIESVAFRLGSCSVSGSQDWLPKSINRVEASLPIVKGLSVSASGPSLAESLAASFADAVAGEDGA